MAFTSDLSIDELLLVEEVGFEPVELVMGSSYSHIGWSSAPWSTNMELSQITALMLYARRSAMQHLIEHAAKLGADGIVGMRIDMEREGHNTEFTAIGTAVRRRAADGARWRNRHGLPFTCDLSGLDFWALVRGGFRPMSLAHGVCVYHVAHQSLSTWFASVGQNMEQPQFTQGLYDARELAMERMQQEAAQAGGVGLVSVEVREDSHGWESHVIEFVAVGTAIAPVPDAAHAIHESPSLAIFAQD